MPSTLSAQTTTASPTPHRRMPAIPIPIDATSLQPGSLAPRHPDASSLIARRPAIQLSSDSALAPDALSGRSIEGRAVAGIIPTYYRVDGPGSGAVVGIVLGSVAGFLVLIWLLYSLTNVSGNAVAGEEEIVVRRPRNSHSGRSRRSTRTEVREYSRSPRRSGGGRSQVIVEERRAPRPRSVVVEERVRVPHDDVVEVIEEHDEYRTRRGSRRGSGYR
ncbi:hypothetical protein BU26DRAFT_608341 [Trematosphaeria pertusa]|uniref:Uncharacterized protein n=1 Tax=Trematosphaeria pertusa TaxID=390896 RepID=A0A6A6I5J2_9PLEO|nr:uncharacterized protein BU26DRAFT_608341 [Trematosphaeria pertusa]KAF2244833.1 hypothetical protein BU26DRAFT_608341 [Trematosphaeria pertusa]